MRRLRRRLAPALRDQRQHPARCVLFHAGRGNPLHDGARVQKYHADPHWVHGPGLPLPHTHRHVRQRGQRGLAVHPGRRGYRPEASCRADRRRHLHRRRHAGRHPSYQAAEAGAGRRPPQARQLAVHRHHRRHPHRWRRTTHLARSRPRGRDRTSERIAHPHHLRRRFRQRGRTRALPTRPGRPREAARRLDHAVRARAALHRRLRREGQGLLAGDHEARRIRIVEHHHGRPQRPDVVGFAYEDADLPEAFRNVSLVDPSLDVQLLY